ncbi:probable calcium-binding protein CML47 [Fagus crenata]
MVKPVDDESVSPISLVVILFSLIILSCLIILRDFYSSFRRIILIFIDLPYRAWKVWIEGKSVSQEASTSIHKHCTHENVDDEKLSMGEVKRVMEKLGNLCEHHPDDEINYVGSDEIAGLFEEEPSPEEVKEAFDIFDENNDGFIDAGELGRVLCTLGLMEPLELECQRMIGAFDDNGDGRIDFKEFVKLVEHSFC